MAPLATLEPTAARNPDAVRRARRTPLRRRRLVIAGLSLALLLAFAARVLLGDFTYTIPDFFRILFGADLPGATYILMESKLPRAVLAVLVGLAFGVGGAIFQTTLRNPLASPDIIGVSAGASASAVVAIVILDLDGWPVSVAAVLGAVVVAATARAVAGHDTGIKLVLVGVGLAAALQSVIQYVFTRADEYDAQLVLRWLTGSVSRADWPTIRILALVLLLLLPLTVWLARSLRVTELGEDAAVGPGRAARTDRPAARARRGADRGRRRRRRSDRLRRVPGRPDRPGAQRRPDHPARRRPGRAPPSWSPPTTWPTTCWPTSTSPSASSPVPSGHRSCSGCSRAAAPEGGRDDRLEPRPGPGRAARRVVPPGRGRRQPRVRRPHGRRRPLGRHPRRRA